jgi:hypothetical protein
MQSLMCFSTGVLRGPSCKTEIFADWDRPKAEETLNAQTFIANNGKYEAMQFDGVLNKVCRDVPRSHLHNFFPARFDFVHGPLH